VARLLEHSSSFELRVEVLGPPSFTVRGERVPLGAKLRTTALVGYLAVHNDRAISRDTLAAVLWPDCSDAISLGHLRRTLYRLDRYVFPPEIAWLEVDARTIRLSSDAEVSLDVARFERLAANPALAREAFVAYGGELLAGIDDAWIAPHRERLATLARTTGHRALADSLSREDSFETNALAQALLAHDPFDETALRVVLELRERAGDRVGALRAYHAFEERALDELGVEPAPETRAVRERIVDGLERTLAPVDERRPATLPIAATSFVGRAVEICEIVEALLAGRALTLVGIGGIGKTRLAMEIAATLVDVFDGNVAYVDLASIADLEHLYAALAEAIGIVLGPTDDLFARIVTTLRARRALVVLDTCERLSAAAELVERLSPMCGDSRFLAISRQGLGYADEILRHVAPLDDEAARELFIDRCAREGNPSANLDARGVASVVGRLGGIPLAIELAASRTARLGLDAAATSLAATLGISPYRRGRPPRRKTIGVVLDWSHALLDPIAAAVFRRLAVFVGGWTLLTACDALKDANDVASDAIASEAIIALVDASLVVVDFRQGVPRYHFLDPVRDYALERLTLSGERREAERRHAEVFARLGERLTQSYPTHDRAWTELAEPELSNVRAAITWTLAERNDPELGSRIAVHAHPFAARHANEGRAWVALAMSHYRESSSSTSDGYLALAASRFAMIGGQYATTARDAARAEAAGRKLGDTRLLGKALLQVAQSAKSAGRLEEAEERAREAADIFLSEDRRASYIWAPMMLAMIRNARSDFAQARAIYEELIASDADGAQFDVFYIYLNYAEDAFLADDCVEALHLNDIALELATANWIRTGYDIALHNRCTYLVAAGRYEAARDVALAALDICAEQNNAAIIAWVLQDFACIAARMEDLERATRLLIAVDLHLARNGAARGPAERVTEKFLRGEIATLTLNVRERCERDGRALSFEDALEDARSVGFVDGAVRIETNLDVATV